MTASVTLSGLFGKTVNIFSRNVVQLFIAGVIYIIIQGSFCASWAFMNKIINWLGAGPHNAIRMLFLCVFSALSIWISGGMLRFMKGLAEKDEADFTNLFIISPVLLARLILTSIFFTVCVNIGLLILIIPGIIIFCMWSQYSLLLLDGKSGIFESLLKSARMMKGNKLEYLVFVLLITVILSLINGVTCCLGAFFTIPFSFLALAVFHAELKKASEAQGTASSSTPPPAPEPPKNNDEFSPESAS